MSKFHQTVNLMSFNHLRSFIFYISLYSQRFITSAFTLNSK
nr:MAG TPA: hypothetical protein [Bacteriophage sp.]